MGEGVSFVTILHLVMILGILHHSDMVRREIKCSKILIQLLEKFVKRKCVVIKIWATIDINFGYCKFISLKTQKFPLAYTFLL